MAVEIIMPKFGMTQETATVLSWLVAEGDEVEKGDPLMEVETDKVTMEVEAPAGGVLRGVCVAEGDVVPVTEIIGYVVPAGESWSPPETSPGVKTPSAKEAPAREEPPATPVARRVAREAGLDLAAVPVPGDGHRLRRQDVEAYLAERENGAPETRTVRATPAARRVAAEHGLDLASVTGSGPRGRVQEADVAAAAVAAGPEPVVEKTPEPAGEPQPLSRMRRTIATRLQASYREIPHINFTVTADMGAALDLRRRLNEMDGDGPRVSVTALLVQVSAWALRRHPQVNASWHEGGIIHHPHAHVGVAVALEDGLIVPVLHHAEGMRLSEIARRLSDVTERARAGELTPDEVQGGTFTISNLGMFGVDHFTAIINPPQSAILAVGRVAKQQVVREGPAGDELVIRPLLQMTLAVDHRVLDGAVAARFLQDVVAALEQPELLLW